MWSEEGLDKLVEFSRAHSITTSKLDDKELKNYFRVVIKKDRLLGVHDTQDLSILGYIESWRINFNQLGRLVCHTRWNIARENINDGEIAYVADIVVDPNHRNGKVLTMIKHLFYMQNYMCNYFVGEARRKKSAPFKVFKRQEFYDQFIITAPVLETVA